MYNGETKTQRGLWLFHALHQKGFQFFFVISSELVIVMHLFKDGFRLGLNTLFSLLHINSFMSTHTIFVKLEENTFLGMPKVTAWSIFTLSML